MEIVALDTMQLENKTGYVLVGIDYYTKFIATELLVEKTGTNVVNVLRKWMEEG